MFRSVFTCSQMLRRIAVPSMQNIVPHSRSFQHKKHLEYCVTQPFHNRINYPHSTKHSTLICCIIFVLSGAPLYDLVRDKKKNNRKQPSPLHQKHPFFPPNQKKESTNPPNESQTNKSVPPPNSVSSVESTDKQ